MHSPSLWPTVSFRVVSWWRLRRWLDSSRPFLWKSIWQHKIVYQTIIGAVCRLAPEWPPSSTWISLHPVWWLVGSSQSIIHYVLKNSTTLKGKDIMSETLDLSALILLAVALVGTLVKCELVDVTAYEHLSCPQRNMLYTGLYITLYRAIFMLPLCHLWLCFRVRVLT